MTQIFFIWYRIKCVLYIFESIMNVKPNKTIFTKQLLNRTNCVLFYKPQIVDFIAQSWVTYGVLESVNMTTKLWSGLIKCIENSDYDIVQNCEHE